MNAKIVGIGACVADTLYDLAAYPAEDTKARALHSRKAGGGPTATALVAAQKLGGGAAYIGVLSDDGDGVFLIHDFERYGVDTSLIKIVRGFRSFTSVIWLCAASASRTCVFDKGDLTPLVLNEKQTDAIRKADILMVDGNELSAAVAAAKIARQSGTTVLYDCGGLYDGVEELLALTDIMIPSGEFARGHTGCADLPAAAEKLARLYAPRVIVITDGKSGGVLCENGDLRRYPAYPATVVDSNGAGDVFHGAFAAGLVRGYDYEKCCHFASAASALKCRGVGARENIPTFETLNAYLKENGYEL